MSPRPRGRPLAPTTDAIVEVSEEDVERARLLWREDAPPRFRELLDAELVDEARLEE